MQRTFRRLEDGLSPQVRGPDLAVLLVQHDARIIPAPAGTGWPR